MYLNISNIIWLKWFFFINLSNSIVFMWVKREEVHLFILTIHSQRSIQGVKPWFDWLVGHLPFRHYILEFPYQAVLWGCRNQMAFLQFSYDISYLSWGEISLMKYSISQGCLYFGYQSQRGLQVAHTSDLTITEGFLWPFHLPHKRNNYNIS